MNPLPDLRPQVKLTEANAPLTTWLRKTPDEKARKRLRAAATVEAIGAGEIEWVDADGWRYQLEAPPVVTIAPKDNERAAATVDLKVWDASDTLIFRDRIHAWDGFPVLVPDGTQHKETLPDGTTYRVDNFRESPVEAARSDLAHTVRVVTKNGPWVKAKPGTVSTFYSGAGDGYLRKYDATYLTARTMASATVVSGSAALLYVGQYTGYYCWESFIDFDTSAIPDADDVTIAVLSLDGAEDTSATDFTVEARLYDWGGTLGSADAVAGADLGSHTLLASWDTSGYSASYNDFTSEAAFVSNISKTGTTSLILNSSRHRNGDTPTGGEFVGFWDQGAAGTTEDPKLVVTHAPATPKTMLLLGIG